MTTNFANLINDITNLSATDDKILFACCGCFIFLVIVNAMVNLIKGLMGVWR